MINPASIFAKIDAFLGNIVTFNNSLLASVQMIETALGPGAASSQLALVAATVEAFSGQVGLAKQLMDSETAAFTALVAAVTNIVNAAKALTKDPTAAVAAAPAKA